MERYSSHKESIIEGKMTNNLYPPPDIFHLLLSQVVPYIYIHTRILIKFHLLSFVLVFKVVEINLNYFVNLQITFIKLLEKLIFYI